MSKKLFGLVAFVATFAFAAVAFAEDGAAANEYSVQVATMNVYMSRAWASGLAIALAAIGGAFAQGRAAAAALDGIARNPNASGKLFVPMILGLALIESLVIYALLIAAGFIGPMGAAIGN